MCFVLYILFMDAGEYLVLLGLLVVLLVDGLAINSAESKVVNTEEHRYI